jgi:hypothetical protein
MVTLTRDFDVFTSSVAARLSAVLLPICHIAKTWDVCAFSGLLILHNNSVPSN